MDKSSRSSLAYGRVLFAICPTGTYCREDRCQSYFKFHLIPTMRAPLEECESAGAIRAVGGRARVLDGPAAKMNDTAFVSQLAAEDPDLIIVVVTFGTLEDDLRWAERIRTLHPKAAIGVRGAPCYVMSQEILERSKSVDFCVRGEYELVFAAIVQEGYRGAPGVAYRDGAQVVQPSIIPRAEDLDSLPRPDRSAIDQSLYTVRGIGAVQATIRVQRGCPFPCTYCLVHTVSGARARHRSPRSVATEMSECMKGGITTFYLRAETFSLDRAWALEVCRQLTTLCPGARWVTTTRIECVDQELLRSMRAAGCYGVSFGMDVTSREIARHVRKLADREQAAKVMRWCDAEGILSLGYIMIGFLWDTDSTVSEAERFVHEVRPDLLTIHFAHPYPGTKYFDDFVSAKGSLHSVRAQAEPAHDATGVSGATLRSRATRMLRTHYARPSVLFSLLRKGLPLALARSFGPFTRSRFWMPIPHVRSDGGKAL